VQDLGGSSHDALGLGHEGSRKLVERLEVLVEESDDVRLDGPSPMRKSLKLSNFVYTTIGRHPDLARVHAKSLYRIISRLQSFMAGPAKSALDKIVRK